MFILLPASPQVSQPVAVVAFHKMDRSRENTLIMLLISDPDMRTVIEEILTSQGYLVQSTTEIGAAVDRLKEGARICSLSGHTSTACPATRL